MLPKCMKPSLDMDLWFVVVFFRSRQTWVPRSQWHVMRGYEGFFYVDETRTWGLPIVCWFCWPLCAGGDLGVWWGLPFAMCLLMLALHYDLIHSNPPQPAQKRQIFGRNYIIYIGLCIVLIISWLFNSPFPTCILWSMINDPAWSAWGSRKEIQHLHLSVDHCLPWVPGWEFLESWNFLSGEANIKKTRIFCCIDWARLKLWAVFEYHPGHPCARTIPVCVREDWPPRARRWKRRGAIETKVEQKTHRFSWRMMKHTVSRYIRYHMV